jgi:hypothetical protein
LHSQLEQYLFISDIHEYQNDLNHSCFFKFSDNKLITLASSYLSEKFDIPPSRMRMVKLFVLLSGALHLSSCFFWRVKVVYLAMCFPHYSHTEWLKLQSEVPMSTMISFAGWKHIRGGSYKVSQC